MVKSNTSADNDINGTINASVHYPHNYEFIESWNFSIMYSVSFRHLMTLFAKALLFIMIIPFAIIDNIVSIRINYLN